MFLAQSIACVDCQNLACTYVIVIVPVRGFSIFNIIYVTFNFALNSLISRRENSVVRIVRSITSTGLQYDRGRMRTIIYDIIN